MIFTYNTLTEIGIWAYAWTLIRVGLGWDWRGSAVRRLG
jgi:hypothetical protein